jgi:hypothetical protein
MIISFPQSLTAAFGDSRRLFQFLSCAHSSRAYSYFLSPTKKSCRTPSMLTEYSSTNSGQVDRTGLAPPDPAGAYAAGRPKGPTKLKGINPAQDKGIEMIFRVRMHIPSRAVALIFMRFLCGKPRE